ncbi:MAG: YtfJ family protein [Prevotellaceae bacterium]|jgi:hypothetical protein|nr:YtfJ family protein [Prevotellaceae bacterium]
MNLNFTVKQKEYPKAKENVSSYMKRVAAFLLCCMFFIPLGAQTKKVVGAVELRTYEKQKTSIRAFGTKPVLLFYVDPDAYLQNKTFRDSLKMEYRDTTNMACCVVINVKDGSSFIPNAMIRKVAEKEVEGANVQLCYDFDRLLRKAWNLGNGVNNTCTIILVNAKGEVEFLKMGELTSQEKHSLLELINPLLNYEL